MDGAGALKAYARWAVITLGVALAAGCNASFSGGEPWSCPGPHGQHLVMTELVFLTDAPNGLPVGDLDWEQFLASTVVQRFSGDVVSFNATNQYWDRTGNKLERQNAKVLMIPTDNSASSEQRIREIVAAYRSRFKQDAILRVQHLACVGQG
jgi:hypothetical protein